jgi:hypothetical protein
VSGTGGEPGSAAENHELSQDEGAELERRRTLLNQQLLGTRWTNKPEPKLQSSPRKQNPFRESRIEPDPVVGHCVS